MVGGADRDISGGNFHGQPLAFALDFLGIALSALAGISERRMERMVNPALNEGLPPFLAPGAGLNSGFMMPQVRPRPWSAKTKCWRIPRRSIRSRLPATKKTTFPWE